MTNTRELSNLLNVTKGTIFNYLRVLPRDLIEYRARTISFDRTNKKYDDSILYERDTLTEEEHRQLHKRINSTIASLKREIRELKFARDPFSKLAPSESPFSEDEEETFDNNQHIFLNGNFYHSIEEAAVAKLLEKYIPIYNVTKGESWQVNVTPGVFIDFLIDETFMEYHPILPFYEEGGRGDFKTHREYQIYLNMKEKTSDPREFEGFVKALFSARYFTERSNAIKEGGYNNPFILCTSVEQVYEKIVSKHTPLLKEEFLGEFKQLIKEIKKQNKFI